MAVVRKRYKCPVCQSSYGTYKDAVVCRNTHSIIEELWAVSKSGKGTRIYDNRAPGSVGSMEWALREAELSDYPEERKRQLAEEKEIRR